MVSGRPSSKIVIPIENLSALQDQMNSNEPTKYYYSPTVSEMVSRRQSLATTVSSDHRASPALSEMASRRQTLATTVSSDHRALDIDKLKAEIQLIRSFIEANSLLGKEFKSFENEHLMNNYS